MEQSNVKVRNLKVKSLTQKKVRTTFRFLPETLKAIDHIKYFEGATFDEWMTETGEYGERLARTRERIEALYGSIEPDLKRATRKQQLKVKVDPSIEAAKMLQKQVGLLKRQIRHAFITGELQETDWIVSEFRGLRCITKEAFCKVVPQEHQSLYEDVMSVSPDSTMYQVREIYPEWQSQSRSGVRKTVFISQKKLEEIEHSAERYGCPRDLIINAEIIESYRSWLKDFSVDRYALSAADDATVKIHNQLADYFVEMKRIIDESKGYYPEWLGKYEEVDSSLADTKGLMSDLINLLRELDQQCEAVEAERARLQ